MVVEPAPHTRGSSEPQRLIQDYLELITNGQEGSLVLWSSQTKAHMHFRTDQLDQAAAAAMALSSARQDIYVRLNVQSELGTTTDTVSALTAVSLDFDLAGPGHKAGNLPTTEEEFDRLLSACEVPSPTVTLRTGGGLLGLWVLEMPLQIDSEVDRKRAEQLSKGFQSGLRRAAQAASFHIDATGDLVRAARIPALRNWKSAYGPDGARVTVRDWSGSRLSLADLERLAEQAAPPPRPQAATARTRNAGSSKPNWEAVRAGCDAMRKWAEMAEGLAEPHWYAMAGVVGHCEDGRAIFHALSATDGRYDPAEAEAKLDHALEASGPRLCQSIVDLGGDCARCPFRATTNSPIGLGYADAALIELARRWVFVAERDVFFDLYEIEGRPA